jgi:ribosome-binding factor A
MLDRMDRVCEAMKREVSLILQEEINDPRINGLSITKVEVSRDLRNAKVYYLGLSEEALAQETEKALKRASSFIRGELAKRITMKFTPRLIFIEDKDEAAKESIEKTFEKIEKEYEEEGKQKEGTENER